MHLKRQLVLVGAVCHFFVQAYQTFLHQGSSREHLRTDNKKVIITLQQSVPFSAANSHSTAFDMSLILAWWFMVYVFLWLRCHQCKISGLDLKDMQEVDDC
jgi:hypothetical protein